MRKFIFSLLTVLTISAQAAVAPIGYPSGADARMLYSNIDLNGQSKILSGTVDPSSTATSAPIGSIYLNATTGLSYRKLDAGSTTNWQNLSLGTAGIITDYVTYTPTITGFGTVTSNSAEWRRVGDTLEVRGRFVSGTSTVTVSRISLPSGLVVDSTKALLTGQQTQSFGHAYHAAADAAFPAIAVGPYGITYNSTVSTTEVLITSITGTSQNHFLQTNASGLAASGEAIAYNFSIPISGWSTPQVLNPAQVGQIWSGYHDNTCSWARTNTAYGDPTADATCNLTQRKNQNMGTVTSYGGASTLPGIVFTPTSTGLYYVCAGAKGAGAVLAATLDVRLYDISNSEELSSFQEQVFVGGNQQFIPTCGVVSMTANTSKTITLQTKASSGAVTLAAGATSTSSIDWSIIGLTYNFPQPVIANSIITNSVGVEYMNRASVTANCTASPCTIARQSGSWLSSITRSSTGVYVLNYTGFSATPTCTCNASNASGVANNICNPITATTGSTTSLTINVTNGGAAADGTFDVQCLGPK